MLAVLVKGVQAYLDTDLELDRTVADWNVRKAESVVDWNISDCGPVAAAAAGAAAAVAAAAATAEPVEVFESQQVELLVLVRCG